MVLFAFQFYPVCNFGNLSILGLVRSEVMRFTESSTLLSVDRPVSSTLTVEISLLINVLDQKTSFSFVKVINYMRVKSLAF